jgi:hypothetical protein
VADDQEGDDVTIREMLEKHPRPIDVDRDLLVRCIEDCFDCVAACTSCADACVAEPDVEDLRRCIRLCLDCADQCGATGRMVTRQTEPDLGVLRVAVQACAAACSASAAECERHAAHHEHCRVCAGVCRRCEQACNELAAAIG